MAVAIESYWRRQAIPVIREVIERNGLNDPAALRRALRASYPWGPRRHHAYRIWCDEIHRQLGTGRYAGRPEQRQGRVMRAEHVSAGQLSLLDMAPVGVHAGQAS